MSPLIDRARRASGPASTIVAALLWAAIPKCPFCVAAWLAGAGIGAQYAAVLAPLLRPVALALIATAALLVVIGAARRSRKRCCSGLIATGPSGR
jgi:hypothetical protein